VVLLGIKAIKQWATLITLAGIDDKPLELMVISLQRARFCQLLAQERGANNADAYFTAGLFSTLEAMLDKPFAELLAQLSLSEELDRALLNRDGAMGEVLNAVIAFEEANWSNVALPGIGAPQLQKHYLDAVAWSRDAAAQLSAAHSG
jgi:EAL and modified HD-GYP domain-containing signal transduction protein